MGMPHEKASLFTKDAVGCFEAEEKSTGNPAHR
jgi:hypothetical protein